MVSAEAVAKIDDLCGKIWKYVIAVENELSLYPPGNIVNPEKKEMLWNLYHSGISEELIAEQLDLDVNTVKMLIAENQVIDYLSHISGFELANRVLCRDIILSYGI